MRALGLDLGGSKLLACLIDEKGSVLGRAVRPTGRGTGPQQARRLVADAAAALRASLGPFDLAGVGFPGLVDHGHGIVRASVMLDGWRDVPFALQLAEELGVPCVLDNDVNAAAVAELSCRADDPPGSMLFVAIGTGIGGAIVFDDRLWRGHTGVAGEIGNVTIDRHGLPCWCGRRGCLNTSASGSAIERDLQQVGRSIDRLQPEHEELDPVLHESATALGIGLANALNLLNPALVALGGGVTRLGPRWFDVVAATARAEAFPEAAQCRIEPARAGYDAGAIGAALLAMETTTSAERAAPGAPAERGTRAPSGDPPPGR